MSALTLPSVIAPAAPSVPQGPSGEAASGFESLLAGLSGEAAVLEARSGPTEPPTLDEAKVETGIQAQAVAGFLIPPTPLVLPAAERSPTGVGVGGLTDGAGEAGADAVIPPSAKVGAADDPDGVQTTTPLPTDKGPPSKTTRPEVQPPLPDIRPLTGEASETQPTLAGTAAETEARARTGAAPAPPFSPPTAPPPPLRPLAERTSKPLDGPVARTGDASRVNDPAQPTAANVTPATPAAADQPGRPSDFVTAPPVRDTASGGDAERPTSELPSPVDGGTAQTQAPAPAGARETLVSQLSRSTIEATAQIAAQILRRLEGRSTRFEMALTPDELGRVDVKLDIDSEGRLNARLAFDNPLAATDMKGRVDDLRRQLEDAGFHLAEDAFEFADRDSGSSAFDRGQKAHDGQSRAFAAASRLNAEIDVAQPPRWLALSLSPSGVDMKV